MPDDAVIAAVAVDGIDARSPIGTDEWLRRVLRALDATDEAVLMFDVDTLQYMYANAGASRLLGRSNAELLAMTPLHFLPGASEAEYRRRFATVLDGADTSDVVQAGTTRPDGTDVVVEATYRFDGEQWMIVVCRDVTDRLAGEAALRRAEQVASIATERERIAVDLQDRVVQSLFAHSCQLAAMLPASDDSTRRRITALTAELDATMEELQTVVRYLHGAAAEPGGLRSRLLDEVRNAGARLGSTPRLQLDGAVDSVDGRLAEQLLDALRGSLAEVAEHGSTGAVDITVSAAYRLTMTLAVDSGDVSPHGPFVRTLARSARAVDGTVTLVRRPHGRALLTWTMPRAPTSSTAHLGVADDAAPTGPASGTVEEARTPGSGDRSGAGG